MEAEAGKTNPQYGAEASFHCGPMCNPMCMKCVCMCRWCAATVIMTVRAYVSVRALYCLFIVSSPATTFSRCYRPLHPSSDRHRAVPAHLPSQQGHSKPAATVAQRGMHGQVLSVI